MKASKLIKMIQKKIDKYGDCETGIEFVGSKVSQEYIEGSIVDKRYININ